MPGKKENYKAGKYGKYNSEKHTWDVYTMLFGTINDFLTDEESKKDFDKYTKIAGDRKEVKGDQEKGIMGRTFDKTFKFENPEQEREFFELSDRYIKRADELLKSEDEKIKSFRGYIKLFKVLADPQRGRYAEIREDNPYFFEIYDMLVTSVKTDKYKELSDQVDEKGRKAPLCHLNDYFENTAELLEREYERQELNENPSPEKEAEFLAKLNETFKKTLSDYDAFRAFAEKNVDKETGKSKYDSCFSNALDMFTGVYAGDSQNSNRNPGPYFAHIRGQQKAIENGWGLNELEIPGFASEIQELLRYRIEREKFSSDRNRIQRQITEKQDQLAKAQKMLSDAKKKSDKSKIDTIQAGIKNLNRDLKVLNRKLTEPNKNLEELLKLQEEATRLNERIQNTKNPSRLQKDAFANEVTALSKIVAEHNFPAIEVDAIRHFRNNQIYKGRKTEKLPDNVMKAEDFEKFGNFFLMKDVMMNTTPYFMHNDNELMQEINPDVVPKNHKNIIWDDIFADERGLNPGDKFGMMQGVNQLEIKQTVNATPAEQKFMRDSIAKIRKSFKNFADNLDETSHVFKPFYDCYVTQMDQEQGDYLRLITEKPYAQALMQSLGGGPALSYNKNDKNTNKQTRDILEEKGVLQPLMGYYSGVNDYMQAEYYKQREEKNGWTKAKENEYRRRLYASIEKVTKNFDKLYALPEEVHNSKTGLENQLCTLTGKGNGTVVRGVHGIVSGMKWQMQAIKNGWRTEDLDAISTIGYMEGKADAALFNAKSALEKAKKDAAEKPDNKALADAVTKAQTRVANIEDFRENSLSKFKDYVFKKQIRHPSDVLEVLNEAERFKEANKDHPAVTNEKLFIGGLGDAENYYRQSTNKAISDIKKLNAGKTKMSAVMPRPVVGAAQEAAPKDETIENIRKMPEKEIKTEYAIFLATGALRNKFLSEFDRNSQPGLFDSKNVFYKNMNTELDDQILKYTQEMVRKMGGDGGRINRDRLADVLENGNFSTFVSDVGEKLKATESNCRISLFVKGVVKTGTGANEKKEKVDSAIRNSYNALSKYDNWFSGSYGEICADYKKIVEQKKAFDKEILRKASEAEANPGRTDVNIDGKKFTDFTKNTGNLIARLEHYKSRLETKKSNNTITTKEGNRLESINYAIESLRGLQVINNKFNGEGMSAENQRVAHSGYKIDIEGIENAASVKKTKEGKELSVLNKKAETLLQKETDTRRILKPNDAIIAEDRGERLIESAKRTLYIDTVKSCLGERNEENLKPQNLKKYNEALDDFSAKGMQSEQFKSFENKLFKNREFVDNFKDRLLEVSGKGREINSTVIADCRDLAIRNCAKNAANNPDKLNELNDIAKGLGSNVYVQNVPAANAHNNNNPQVGHHERQLGK